MNVLHPYEETTVWVWEKRLGPYTSPQTSTSFTTALPENCKQIGNLNDVYKFDIYIHTLSTNCSA